MTELIDKIYRTSCDEEYRENDIDTLINGTTEDKRCLISSLYGIFDSSMKGNIYTYYFWSSDVSIGGIFNYSGKRREREWRKIAKCFRVDYNIKTCKAVVKRTRWNKRCVENADRML